MSVTVVLLVAALALVGLCGIVVPVLPGSICVGLACLGWAIWGTSSWGWTAFWIGAALVAVGMSASLLLTKRDLDRRDIPRWPVVTGVACGLLAGFVVPVVGLPLGFALGLFGAEWWRVGSPREARETSVAALRAIGTGMLVELGCAMAATAVLGASVVSALV